MVVVPIPTLVTTPVALTVATPVLVLLHVPPAGESVRLAVPPRHMVTGDGVIGPAPALTVTVAVAKHEPIVYDMVTVPAVTPVTTPDALTVAFALPALHTPPVVTSVRLTVAPVQTVAVAGVIGVAELLTVTITEEAHPPTI